MSTTAQLGQQASVNGGVNSISKTEDFTVSETRVIDFPVVANTADQVIPFTLAYANLKVLAIQAVWATTVTTPLDLTLETNSSSAAAQTFTLKPNSVSSWNSNSAFSNPITTNITALYVTNPHATEGCTLRIVVGNN